MRLQAYVLAGGHGSRMGAEKSALPFRGGSLLEVALEKANAVAERAAILCGQDAGRARGLAEAVLDMRVDAGPFAALEAALHHATAEWPLLLGIDMPLLLVNLLRV